MFYDYQAAIYREHLCYPAAFQIYGCTDSHVLFGFAVFTVIMMTLNAIGMIVFFKRQYHLLKGNSATATFIMLISVVLGIPTRVAVLIPAIPVTARSLGNFTVQCLVPMSIFRNASMILRMVPDYILENELLHPVARKLAYGLRHKKAHYFTDVFSMLPVFASQFGWMSTSLKEEFHISILYPCIMGLLIYIIAISGLHVIARSLKNVRSEFVEIKKNLKDLQNVSSTNSTAPSTTASTKNSELELTLRRFDNLIKGFQIQYFALTPIIFISIYLCLAFDKVISSQNFRYPFTVFIDGLIPVLTSLQIANAFKSGKLDPAFEELFIDETTVHSAEASDI